MNERRSCSSVTPSRRALLSAGAATFATAIAGCSELPDFSEDDTDRPDDSPALPTDAADRGSDPGSAALATARDALVDVQTALDGFVDRLPPVYSTREPPNRVPTDRVEAGLRTARRALDRIGSDPPPARERTATALAGYADFQSAASEYLGAYLPVLHDVEAYRAYRHAGRYEPAGTALSSATEGLDGLSEPRDAATSALNGLDRDALAAVDVRLSASSVPGWVADGTARGRFASRLLGGFSSEVAGLVTLQSAGGAFDDGRYSRAEEQFLSAKSTFSEAHDRFVSLESGTAALPGATDVAVGYACRADAMFDHCDAMAAASRAASFDQTSGLEAARERARDARERAEGCVSSE